MGNVNRKLWRTFIAICEAMEDADFELTTSDFAAFYAMFTKLRRIGAKFDDAFVAHVEALREAAKNTSADSDSDASDEGTENDLPESFKQPE